MTISTSAQANLNILQIGTHDGSASVSVSSGATLSTASTLAVGGGATARTVSLDVTGGTLTTSGLAILDNQAVLTLGSGGAINFNGGANASGGQQIQLDRRHIQGGLGTGLERFRRHANPHCTGGPLSPDATLSITNGGKVTSTNAFGITSGTLNVANAGSSITVNGASAWSPAANVNLTDNGVATYTAGLKVGQSGTATVNINTGGG